MLGSHRCAKKAPPGPWPSASLPPPGRRGPWALDASKDSDKTLAGDVMARTLSKSNAHFQRAVKRLPLGVASNFRYWGDDRTI